ncbi:MAG: DUF1800 family protein [Planctomycetota bacterium]|nr:MAG: DUF1800 family protein [Planctomycetota bacterium]
MRIVARGRPSTSTSIRRPSTRRWNWRKKSPAKTPRDLQARPERGQTINGRHAVTAFTTAIPENTAVPADAWEPLEPREATLGHDRASYLLRRTCLGATKQVVDSFAELKPADAVDRLLRSTSEVEYDSILTIQMTNAVRSGNTAAYRGWWLRKIGDAAVPFQDLMLLFWVDFFGLGSSRIGNLEAFHDFLEKLRPVALGSVRTIFETALNHPAVLLNLQAAENRRSKPNRYLASTFLERYSVGAGHFTDRDVVETARALTGRFVVRSEVKFYPYEFDDGSKEILGSTGNFHPEDIPRIVSEKEETAATVVRRLYRWFVADAVAPNTSLEPLVRTLAEGKTVGDVLRRMFTSRWFFSPTIRCGKIKSPLAFAMTLLRPLQGRCTSKIDGEIVAAGADPLNPPTVAGFPFGYDWINAFSLGRRAALAEAVLRGSDEYGGVRDLLSAAEDEGIQGEEEAQRWLESLLAIEPLPDEVRREIVRHASDLPGGDKAERLRRIAWLMTVQPEFQLG